MNDAKTNVARYDALVIHNEDCLFLLERREGVPL